MKWLMKIAMKKIVEKNLLNISI